MGFTECAQSILAGVADGACGSSTTVLVAVAVLMFMNSFLQTPPSEFVCVGTGLLVRADVVGPIESIAVASIANVAGTTIWYLFGRRRLLESQIESMRSSPSRIAQWTHRAYFSTMDRFEAALISRGPTLLFLVRLVPVVRSVASYPAGRSNVDPLAFLVATGGGVGLWTSMWIAAGAMLGVLSARTSLSITAAVTLAVLLAFHVSGRQARRIVYRRPEQASESTEDSN